MTAWQVLRAGLGHRVHRGPGLVVHYSTAPVPDSIRREKVTLQQLNRRLASYLQQVGDARNLSPDGKQQQ